MPGNVNKSQPQLLACFGGQFKVGEAEIDRDPTPLFFFQPVGINAGERLHQRRFSMIDMPSRADDNRFH